MEKSKQLTGVKGIAELFPEPLKKGVVSITPYEFDEDPLYNLRVIRDSGPMFRMYKGKYVRLVVDSELAMSDTCMKRLKEFKIITYLVKSSSRFFLKPDVGEIFDQIEPEDLDKIKAILFNSESQCIGGEGAHFLMTAKLLK